MPNQFLVNPDVLEERASNINTIGSTIANIIERMGNLINEIGEDAWLGQASAAYSGLMQNFYDSAQRAADRAEEMSNTLHAIANEYEKTEDEIREALERLPDDIF